jgi:hypothetical protein
MVALSAGNATADERGRLASPILVGAANQNCSLKFRFHLEQPEACRLRVKVKVGDEFKVIWVSLEYSNYLFSDVQGLPIRCDNDKFQVIN